EFVPFPRIPDGLYHAIVTSVDEESGTLKIKARRKAATAKPEVAKPEPAQAEAEQTKPDKETPDESVTVQVAKLTFNLLHGIHRGRSLTAKLRLHEVCLSRLVTFANRLGLIPPDTDESETVFNWHQAKSKQSIIQVVTHCRTNDGDAAKDSEIRRRKY